MMYLLTKWGKLKKRAGAYCDAPALCVAQTFFYLETVFLILDAL